jgi:hypothetical protein
MTYMAAFGLASGAGAKAFIPILALGGFHYTPYFELSGRFLWISNPAVMVVLGVMVVLEILVDAHPELGRWTDTVSYLPKMVAGFIGFAAVVGTIDDDFASLAASGLLGAGTAGGVHFVRNALRRPFRTVAEDLHEGVGKAASMAEAGVSLSLAGSALVVPPLALGLAGGVVLSAIAASRAIGRRRVPCTACGQPIRPGALVCVHCGAEQAGQGQA